MFVKIFFLNTGCISFIAAPNAKVLSRRKRASAGTFAGGCDIHDTSIREMNFKNNFSCIV